jgi:hypothetical protein
VYTTPCFSEYTALLDVNTNVPSPFHSAVAAVICARGDDDDERMMI